MENILSQLDNYNQNLTLEERIEFRSKLLGFSRKLQKSIQMEKGNVRWGKRYTEEEKAFKKEKIAEGWSKDQISAALQRTTNGVVQQIQKNIVNQNRVKSTALVHAWCPAKPDPTFLIPQHTNKYSQPA
jgi:hypothetical protein